MQGKKTIHVRVLKTKIQFKFILGGALKCNENYVTIVNIFRFRFKSFNSITLKSLKSGLKNCRVHISIVTLLYIIDGLFEGFNLFVFKIV